MQKLPYQFYRDCIPTEPQQRALATFLLERVKVVRSLKDVTLIGLLTSATVLIEEISRLLRCHYYLLPVLPIVGLDQENSSIIYGAASGIDDAILLDDLAVESMQLTKDQLFAHVSKSKHAIMTEALSYPECTRLMEERDRLKGGCVLLVDSAIVSKVKFDAAIQSLLHSQVSSIIPVAPLINREILFGAIPSVKPGIYLKQFNEQEQLYPVASELRRIEDHELEKYFFG